MRSRALGAGIAALLAAGCAEAGTPYVSLQEAARIGVATSRMTAACGNADQLRAFGGAHPAGLAGQESIALSGARKLAGVYVSDQSRIYQGESVGGVMHDSISLLGGCGLPKARKLLAAALKRH